MSVRLSHASVLGLCASLFAVWAIGCSRSASNPARFVPAPDAAKSALSRVLTAWQTGESAAGDANTRPAVEFVDTHRRANQRLERFEFLGEVGGDAGRCFAVRLQYEGRNDEETARSIVVGIDPIWVFREPNWFTVRRKLGSGDDAEMRYAVVGRELIWVFGEADYLQIGSM